MTLALPGRLRLLGLLGGLALGCSDEGGGLANPGLGGGGAGTTNGGVSSGGSSAGMTSSAGSSGSAALAGAGMGGTNTAGSGGVAGSGGMVMATGGAPPGPASGRHTVRPSGSMLGTTAGYWEYLPPHYGNGALYPLLVFMHGSGENGDGSVQDLEKVLQHGPPKLIEADQWPETRPFVVLSVQKAGGCPTAQDTDALLTFALGNYAIDPKRIYLTGLSCGGYGTWNYLGAHTDEKVAAAVPICGDGRSAFQQAGCQLGKVPIWAFHGETDEAVVPEGSTEPIADLKACANPAAVDVKLTTYPGVGHDSWTMTYNVSNPANDIYAWMLSHSKP